MLRKIRCNDCIVVLASALLWSLSYVLMNTNFIAMVMVSVFLITLTSLIVRKISMTALMIIMGSLFAAVISGLSGTMVNYNILIIFIILGLVFEVLAVAARGIIDEREWLTPLLSGISSAMLPLLFAVIMRDSIRYDMIELVNSLMFYFIIGLLGSLISYVAWYCIRGRRFILETEHKE